MGVEFLTWRKNAMEGQQIIKKLKSKGIPEEHIQFILDLILEESIKLAEKEVDECRDRNLGSKNYKYVIFEGNNPLLIPSDGLINHSDVILKRGDIFSNGFLEPISAGFCIFTNGDVKCYGESISLGLKSRCEEDASIIERHFLRYY